MDKLPEHLKGRTLHIVGPDDDYDEEEPEEIDSEYEQMRVPEAQVDKRQQIEAEKEKEQRAAGVSGTMKNVRLTKHLKEMKKFGPVYTGGQFQILKGGKYGLALNEHKVTLFLVEGAKVLGTHA